MLNPDVTNIKPGTLECPPEESMSFYLNATMLFIIFCLCVVLGTELKSFHTELHAQPLLYFETGPH